MRAYSVGDGHHWVSWKVFPCKSCADLACFDLPKEGYQGIHEINPILRFEHFICLRFSYCDVDRWFAFVEYVDNVLGREMTME